MGQAICTECGKARSVTVHRAEGEKRLCLGCGLEQALGDIGFDTDEEIARAHRMEELCATFPALRNMPGAFPWDPLKLQEAYGPSSSGERVAIAFVLMVWCHHPDVWKVPRFDLADIKRWGVRDLAAFQAWVQNPWWG